MGVLQDTVNSFDRSKDNAAEISEALDLMVELTKAKAEYFQKQIEERLNLGRILGKGDSADSLYFPISSIKDSKFEYRCITSSTPTDLVSDIGKSISSMINDNSASNIVNGVATIINSGLKTIMGLSEGMEQYTSSTSTFIEGKGIAVNIVRFDTIIWGRAVKATSIKNSIKNTLACVAYKSVVDVSKIKFDDFRSVYGPVIEASGESDTLKAIKYAKEVYEALDGGSALAVKPNLKKQYSQSLPTKEIARAPLSIDELCFISMVAKSEDSTF